MNFIFFEQPRYKKNVHFRESTNLICTHRDAEETPVRSRDGDWIQKRITVQTVYAVVFCSDMTNVFGYLHLSDFDVYILFNKTNMFKIFVICTGRQCALKTAAVVGSLPIVVAYDILHVGHVRI